MLNDFIEANRKISFQPPLFRFFSIILIYFYILESSETHARYAQLQPQRFKFVQSTFQHIYLQQTELQNFHTREVRRLISGGCAATCGSHLIILLLYLGSSDSLQLSELCLPDQSLFHLIAAAFDLVLVFMISYLLLSLFFFNLFFIFIIFTMN